MGLNYVKKNSNMYQFVNATWNPIKGKCMHDCEYCYMKIFKLPELHFDEREMKTDLGKHNIVFVGSSCDMFAKTVPAEWIENVLKYCKEFDNQYLFQSKNSIRFNELIPCFPDNTILGTTIETNRLFPCMGNAPPPQLRFLPVKFQMKMITIEPIMKFDLDKLVVLIRCNTPNWVNIGADSKGHNLPEPSGEKIRELIYELQKFTVIKNKSNLERLMK